MLKDSRSAPKPTLDQEPDADSAQVAANAGLRYVSDHDHGIYRKRRGKKFFYVDHAGKKITQKSVLERIRKIVIPPAWEDVWICKTANGHLQATGRDARKRKQYKYHADWSAARNESKFDSLADFGEMLPMLREHVERDLRLHGMPREKVLAAAVRVMELTHIRIGNEVYAQDNESYGLTTMLNEHATVRGAKVRFRFKGKSGVQHDVEFSDPRLSRLIHRCQELPGEELFTYEDHDGNAVDVRSEDVNEYLRAITNKPISAKIFRTWAGTVQAIECLAGLGPCEATSERAHKMREVSIIKEVAAHLRNTVSVCRKYYVHPTIFEKDRDGHLHKIIKSVRKGPAPAHGLSHSEKVLLKVLQLNPKQS